MEKKPCILSARLLLFLYPKLNLRKNPLTAHASAPRRVRPPGQSAPKPHAEQRRAAELSDSAKPSAPPRPSARGHRVKAPHNLSQSDAEPQRLRGDVVTSKRVLWHGDRAGRRGAACGEGQVFDSLNVRRCMGVGPRRDSAA